MERVALYLMSALLLLFAAFVTFRVIVRRDYERLGRLRPFTGFLELLVWSVFVCIPSIYDPPDWWWPWTADDRWNSCCGCCDGGAWNVKDIWTRSGRSSASGIVSCKPESPDRGWSTHGCRRRIAVAVVVRIGMGSALWMYWSHDGGFGRGTFAKSSR